MNEEEEETNSLRDLIQNLTANMESNFAKLHEELCGLRQEMKEEIGMLKSNIKGVEKSVDEIWKTIEDMKEAAKALKDSKTVREDEMQELRALLTKTKAELKEERDRVIELEDYTRRENLKFHNIPESEEEGVNHSPKQVILSILQKELHMDTAQIRFHPVHRIQLASEKKTNTLLASFAEKTEIRFLPGRRNLKREVQKSDRINSDRQSVSDQLGSTRTNSDRIKKIKIK